MALRKNKPARKRERLIPKIKTNRERVLQAGLFFLLVLACLSHFKAAFLAQLAFSNSDNLPYFSAVLTDPGALSQLARKEHLINVNLGKAKALYTGALENFVLHVPSWLGLTELYYDQGDPVKAAAALKFLQGFASDNEQNAWTRAMLAHQLDQVDIMTENLTWLAGKFPGKRRQVFALAEQHWPDPAELMKRFEPSLYPDIVEYYISNNDAPRAEAAWWALTAANEGEPKVALRYVNYLLGLKEVQKAALVWRNHYARDGALLYNPGMQGTFLNSGFDWRISQVDGVAWRHLPEEDGLEIHFDGTGNPAFSIRQIVPLFPGDYVLSGIMESADLTTDQRPHWLISGYQCDGLRVKGEMISPSSAAAEFSVAFTVPPGCFAAQIALQRSTSYFFDNKIAGTVTVRDLHLGTSGYTREPAPPLQGTGTTATPATMEKAQDPEAPPAAAIKSAVAEKPASATKKAAEVTPETEAKPAAVKADQPQTTAATVPDTDETTMPDALLSVEEELLSRSKRKKTKFSINKVQIRDKREE